MDIPSKTLRSFSDPSRSKFSQVAGFTLPEITLTIGIVGFVLIPLLGLLAMSANNTYDADTATISSSIATALLGDAQQASQEQIEDWQTGGGVDSYYDFQGVEIDSVDDSIFTARMIIETGGVDFGGSSPNTHASRVLVHVCNLQGQGGTDKLDEIKNDPDAPRSLVRTFTSIRTNLEKVKE